MTTYTRTNLNLSKWTIDENTRLSISEWDMSGRFYSAVAIERKRPNGSWFIDSEMALEASFDAEWRRGYFKTDAGYPLVVAEFGYTPERFFRDNYIAR